MERLKALREEKGISQQKLAEKIQTNQQNIHRYHGNPAQNRSGKTV